MFDIDNLGGVGSIFDFDHDGKLNAAEFGIAMEMLEDDIDDDQEFDDLDDLDGLDDEDDFCDYLIRSEIYGKYAIGMFDISNNKIHCYETHTFNYKNNKLTPVAGGDYHSIDCTLGETFEYTSNNTKTITFTVRE